MKKSLVNKNVILHLFSSDKFKGIFLCSIVIAFYGGAILSSSDYNFTMNIKTVLSYNFFALLFFILFCYNSYQTLSIVNRDFKFIIYRTKSKLQYINQSFKLIFISNMYLLLIFSLLFLTIYNIIGPGFSLIKMGNILELIIYIIKYFIITSFLIYFLIYLKIYMKKNSKSYHFFNIFNFNFHLF